MNRNSISGMSRALIAAVLLATAALSGCATVGDESFLYCGQRRSRARSYGQARNFQTSRTTGSLTWPRFTVALQQRTNEPRQVLRQLLNERTLAPLIERDLV